VHFKSDPKVVAIAFFPSIEQEVSYSSELTDPRITGDIGITALIPVVVFFGTGMLTQNDFDTLSWNVLILMGGGLALGVAIQGGSHSLNDSLLAIIASNLKNLVESQSTWVISLTFAILMWFAANVISSTVSAAIVLPLLFSVGRAFHSGKLLVMVGALVCSGAMALPVSSFPNANSFAVRKRNGEPYLQVMDYIKCGIPIGVGMIILVQTIAFFLSKALGL